MYYLLAFWTFILVDKGDAFFIVLLGWSLANTRTSIGINPSISPVDVHILVLMIQLSDFQLMKLRDLQSAFIPFQVWIKSEFGLGLFLEYCTGIGLVSQAWNRVIMEYIWHLDVVTNSPKDIGSEQCGPCSTNFF